MIIQVLQKTAMNSFKGISAQEYSFEVSLSSLIQREQFECDFTVGTNWLGNQLPNGSGLQKTQEYSFQVRLRRDNLDGSIIWLGANWPEDQLTEEPIAKGICSPENQVPKPVESSVTKRIYTSNSIQNDGLKNLQMQWPELRSGC